MLLAFLKRVEQTSALVHPTDTNHFDSISEPNGREQSIVQNNHHISMVPTLLGHSLFEQERSFRREDHVFASGRLLP